jgi:glycerol uptake facilitator-like aquaporin
LAIGYVLVQIFGAIGGVWLANVMFDLPLLQISTHVRTGMGQWIGEIVATFGLIMTILGGKRQLPGQVPILVAAWIGAACFFTSSTSFANPAITLARAFTDTFTGIAPQSITGFVVAQLIGAFIAAAILPRLFFGTWFGVDEPHENQHLKE